jgi:predicted transglutaminase-like cysteine proteinase
VEGAEPFSFLLRPLAFATFPFNRGHRLPRVYGVIQWWRYPDDGAGACHSYALLKRRMLMQAGWPRSALLMTVVREANGEGHAVLTVKTNKGEFILDNLSQNILLWSETPYHYIKRQSQTDPNVWVSQSDPREVEARTSSILY